MLDIPMTMEVCLCGECEIKGHTKEMYRPLTQEELTQRELDIATANERKLAEEAKQNEKNAILAILANTAGLTVEELKSALS